MNTQTTELLEKLAAKLGTTTEYLWSVLISQAPIAASTTLLHILLVAIFGAALYKVHKNLMKPFKDGSSRSYYEQYEIAAFLPMFIAGLAFLLLVVALFFSVSNMINGFFNPEYWALDQILKQL